MNHRNIILLPSCQERTADTDLFSVAMDPPAKTANREASVLSAGSEADDETVEIE